MKNNKNLERINSNEFSNKLIDLGKVVLKLWLLTVPVSLTIGGIVLYNQEQRHQIHSNQNSGYRLEDSNKVNVSEKFNGYSGIPGCPDSFGIYPIYRDID